MDYCQCEAVTDQKREYQEYIAAERQFKETLFQAVCQFLNHQSGCSSCQVLDKNVYESQEHLCQEGRRILHYWFNEPAFTITRLIHTCSNCNYATCNNCLKEIDSKEK